MPAPAGPPAANPGTPPLIQSGIGSYGFMKDFAELGFSDADFNDEDLSDADLRAAFFMAVDLRAEVFITEDLRAVT